jgi:hypothetical protein
VGVVSTHGFSDTGGHPNLIRTNEENVAYRSSPAAMSRGDSATQFVNAITGEVVQSRGPSHQRQQQ